MGITTRFDELRYELEEKIKDCTKILDIMLDYDTWGYEDMKQEYIDAMQMNRLKLYEIIKTF